MKGFSSKLLEKLLSFCHSNFAIHTLSLVTLRLFRLVSLAAQKFVSDVANDALQHCKMRNAGQTIKNNKNKDRKFVMTMEDLGQALGNQGVTVKKPPYYT